VDEQKRVLILRPVGMGEVMATGTMTADCGHECWVAPSSLAGMAEAPMQTVCLWCMKPMHVLDFRLLPGVREELVARWGENEADAALAIFEALRQGLRAQQN